MTASEFLFMNEDVRRGCAHIFRDVTGLKDSAVHFGWSDERLFTEPLDALGVDSLTLLEFVMKVETAYNVELDEEDVNLCTNVGDLVALVMAARNGTS
jgi:acyl carrier protein